MCPLFSSLPDTFYFLQLPAPWFEVVTVAASPRSAGKTYEDAVGGRWKMDTPMPEAVKKLVVMNVNVFPAPEIA